MSVQNPPDRHHYLPEFYLKRWVGGDGRLCQFSRPYKDVLPLRRYPKQVGFVRRLYALKGVPPEHASVFEQQFFRPVDESASDALTLMERSTRPKWDSRRRTGWVRFLHSLLVRTPEEMEHFRAAWRQQLTTGTESFEARYSEVRKPSHPETFAEYMLARPDHEFELSAMKALCSLIDNPRIGLRLAGMFWDVLDCRSAGIELLTSDRPLIRTNGLHMNLGHWAMPIGPDRIFLMAPDPRTIQAILRAPLLATVKETNRQVVAHAVRYVYGRDDRQLAFVQKRMSTVPLPSFVLGLWEAQKDRRARGLSDEKLLGATPRRP